MKSRIKEEILLIALIAVGFPTVGLLVTAGLWWAVEPVKVFTGYLLAVVGLAALCGAVSVYDEAEKERGRHG